MNAPFRRREGTAIRPPQHPNARVAELCSKAGIALVAGEAKAIARGLAEQELDDDETVLASARAFVATREADGSGKSKRVKRAQERVAEAVASCNAGGRRLKWTWGKGVSGLGERVATPLSGFARPLPSPVRIHSEIAVPLPPGLMNLARSENWSPAKASLLRQGLADLDRRPAREAADRARNVVEDWASSVAEMLQAQPPGFDADAFAAALAREAARLPATREELGSFETTLRDRLDGVFERVLNRYLGHLRGARVRSASGFDDYVALFPAARALGRKLTLFVGPTNSGKTYEALRVAMAAPTAVVLSPLRLLALEHYETLADAGLAAGMITGEESIDAEGATHVAQTIETVNLSQPVDVALVDEMQMLADPDRGAAWTAAVIGVPAREVVMTGSPECVHMVAKVAELTGEELQVRVLQRKGKLVADERPVPLRTVGRGDAVVAFTRRDVHALREHLVASGLTVATVYGALGPEVRRAEAKRFRNGEADVLVATDAIGLGLNIGPLKRVLFSRLEKFDGEKTRPLTPPEMRQIAGRAGRHGFSDVGVCAVLRGVDPAPLAEAIRSAPQPLPVQRLFVRPTPDAVRAAADELGETSLCVVLRHLDRHLVADHPDLAMASIEGMLRVASAVDKSGLRLEDRFVYAMAPADLRDPGILQILGFWARLHAGGWGRIQLPDVPSASLEDLERLSRRLTLYLWLARRFPDAYPDAEEAARERAAADRRIEAWLARTSTLRGSLLGEEENPPRGRRRR